MNITRDNISPTKVKLTIKLDKSELDDAEKVALHKLARTVKVPGFRKGRAPASVATKYIDVIALKQEAADNALSKAVSSAFSTPEIQAIERPSVEITKFVPGELLEFTAEAEILPDIKLGNYKKLKAPKQEKVSVTKADIDEVLDRILTQMSVKTIVDRAAKLGDEVTIDFVGKKDGAAFEGGSAEGHTLVLGSNSFIPGFEDGIVGHKSGDTFDLELSFPDDYHAEALAGQKVTFTVTLREVKESVKPALDDELAAKVGPFSSVSDLTDGIREELTTQKTNESNEKFSDALVRELIKVSTVHVPDVMRKDQLLSIEQDMTQNLMYQGMTFDSWLSSKGYKSRDEWIDKEAGAIAEERVKAGLVLSELGRAEQIVVSSTDIDARLQTYREQYQKSPETLKQLSTPEVRQDIANRLATEKSIDRLVELNKGK